MLYNCLGARDFFLVSRRPFIFLGALIFRCLAAREAGALEKKWRLLLVFEDSCAKVARHPLPLNYGRAGGGGGLGSAEVGVQAISRF